MNVIVLLPITTVVFMAYLIIGLAMPVLPLYVHQRLELGTIAVGLVIGSQFAAALMTRMWAGHFADSRGPKRALLTGLSLTLVSGILYLCSTCFVGSPMVAVAFVFAGRFLLGSAESFVITGALSWGMSLMSSQQMGKVMSVMGTAIFAAFAVGAPVGAALYGHFGYEAIALGTLLVPLCALPIVLRLRSVATPPHTERAPLGTVARAVCIPGLGLALSGIGYGAITTFIALFFEERGWGPVWPAFTALSVAFMAGRLLGGHLPDRIGGAMVALICVSTEALSLGLIWLAPSGWVALVGVTLAGLGYSLVFPSFGVEALRTLPARNRGLAMGAYTAFLDLSLGISSPILGLVADRAGLRSVFLVSMVAVFCAAAVAIRLRPRQTEPSL